MIRCISVDLSDGKRNITLKILIDRLVDLLRGQLVVKGGYAASKCVQLIQRSPRDMMQAPTRACFAE